MKFLIAGLGNPGEEYRNTRHNIGFKTLDALAQESGVFFSSDRLADRTEFKYRSRTLILIKPTTYMNLSGKAVKYWLDKEHIPLQNLLVVTDDLALPFGQVRLRGKGTDGGHNGLKDIQAQLQSSEYPRLRFGIGNEFLKGHQVNYVLGEWTKEEYNVLPERMELAKQIILNFTFVGLAQTMSQFNNK